MLDGDPVDPFVQRLTLINRICEAFHVLPSHAERELDTDPKGLARLVLEQRGYEAAKHAYDSAKHKVKDLERWDGNPTMELVELHTFELRQEKLAQADAERRGDA